jgi:hypothetical protein
VLIELLRSWQLSRKKSEKKLNGGGGGALLAWPTTAASLQITMEIHISNWTHKFQNRTGLDAKANSELYISNRVCSADRRIRIRTKMSPAQHWFKYNNSAVIFCIIR